jgi:ElaB/YqjD/DUF883 family membrane-anchored ribosome-binding protein
MATETANAARNTGARLEEALELLNETARNKREELKELLDEKYANIRSLLGEMTTSNREIVRQMRDMASERVQRHPLAIVGGVAAGALAIGFLLGMTRSNRY